MSKRRRRRRPKSSNTNRSKVSPPDTTSSSERKDGPEDFQASEEQEAHQIEATDKRSPGFSERVRKDTIAERPEELEDTSDTEDQVYETVNKLFALRKKLTQQIQDLSAEEKNLQSQIKKAREELNSPIDVTTKEDRKLLQEKIKKLNAQISKLKTKILDKQGLLESQPPEKPKTLNFADRFKSRLDNLRRRKTAKEETVLEDNNIISEEETVIEDNSEKSTLDDLFSVEN